MKSSSIENMIWSVLIIGVIISATFLIIGLALTFLTNGASIFGTDFLIAGIFALFATPVMRITVSILMFASEKNRLYTVITAIVFINVMVAIFIVPALLHV